MADTKISALTAASALTGAEIVPVLQSSANRRTTAQDIADLAAAGGLFGAILSAVPTAANTGLSNWQNQNSAAVSDSAIGIALSASSNGNANNIRLRTKTAPSTPYTITALMAMTPADFSKFASLQFGWTDGTKIQAIELSQRDTSPSPLLYVNSYSTVSAFNASHLAGTISTITFREWVQIADDGTTVSFRWSADGANFQTFYSVAKASGYLGSSGYSNIAFGINPYGTALKGTLLSYAEA